MAERRDYYEVLGVDKSASVDDIKAAYRKAALKWHPDRWVNGSEQEKKTAEEKFKEASEAYSVLSDPDKKARYDQFGFAGTGGAGKSEQVVTGFLVRVAEHGIGLGGLLEFLLGGLLLLIRSADPAVGMPFEGGLPVGALYVVRRGVPVNAKHFVIVSSLCHDAMLQPLLLRSAKLCRSGDIRSARRR